MTDVVASGTEFGLTSTEHAMLPPHLRAIRYLTWLLQYRFSLNPVGSYHWERNDGPDNQQSEIYISMESPMPGERIGKRPALLVSRGQLSFQGLGLGDRAFYDFQTDGSSYMDMAPSTLVVNVIARNAYVAERLAWHVQTQIFTFREEITRDEKSILQIGSRIAIPPPAPAAGLVTPADPTWINVPVYIPTYLQATTAKTTINTPMLKGIRVVVRGS